MRAFFLGVLFLAGLASTAGAQLAYGPVAIRNEVNGVPVTIHATSWIAIRPADDRLAVDIRILADLVDVQKQFSDLMRAAALSADECANRRGDNQSPIVTLKNGSLWPRGDQLVVSMRGHIDVWTCTTGPNQAALRWRSQKVAFINLKVPTIHTWRNVTKKKDGTEAFRGVLFVHLSEKKDGGVALDVADPALKFEGPEAVLKDAGLQAAKASINRKASEALQRAIDPARLKEALPAEFQKLSMTLVSARFRSLGGHAIAEINLAATVSGMSKAQLMQRVAANAAH